jgi:hypothetical protein
MRVLLQAILLATGALGLVSGSRHKSTRPNRESKWDIIHHEYHGPPAPLSEDGRVIDTPEVAKARSNHLAIHAETVADLAKKMAEWAKKEEPKGGEAVVESEKSMAEVAEVAEPQVEEAPVNAEPVQEVLEAEEPADAAPEVEEAKPVVESEATNEVLSSQEADSPAHQYIFYKGPFATIGEDGRVQDTPEVRIFDRTFPFSTEQTFSNLLLSCSLSFAIVGSYGNSDKFHPFQNKYHEDQRPSCSYYISFLHSSVDFIP